MSSGFFFPSLLYLLRICEPPGQSVALPVSFLFMLLEHGARGDLFSALAVPAGLPGGFLDVLVLALLLFANPTHVSFFRHIDLPMTCSVVARSLKRRVDILPVD